MEAALIIFSAIVVTGLVLYLHHRLTGADSHPQPDQPAVANAAAEDEECCGMHITCQRDSLLASVSSDVVYYDDEELDTYRGRSSNAYDENEIEQFRDVLLTLLPEDIAGWGRSLQLRGIEMPAEVREELMMIVSEERMKKTAHANV